MKKLILPLMLLLSSNLWAQRDVIKQLDNVHEQSQKTNAPCPTCEEASGVYTPQAALADIKAGNLQFLGRDLFPGSDQNRTCVFKSEKAYILYYNCMASKKEAPATEIEVISFDGGLMRFYVENGSATPGPISKMDRAQYDGTWSVYYIPTAAPGNLNVNQLKAYKERFTTSHGACWIGKTGGAKDMSSKASCYGAASTSLSSWGPSGENFWYNPGKEWPETHQYLRKQVETAKY